ncbi:ACP S-malonyltransferase [Geomonas subterranea]|uniref:Malonyl CoA-acyl carrier protein transacylase n=1 Tax=Geomonas subterranea TaxID=2847989 RepID=A0ABX8LRH9_9BACT|nr:MULTISPECIES: ACP S-malonyltransferase [Geomonas]QXE92889.1 ACP S-malonyltransferase [Geomonas subterranea]QXM09006.1 ACP S-malonyltransferase [Geomonas subterranea]
MQSYAFIFPGQGSQHAGMGKDLADNFKTAKVAFEEADDALGFSLSKLCFEGPEEDLKLTANTQPAILAASVAAFRVLREESPLAPSFVAGHSLGEYSALVAAGALDFADALRTVRARGSYMQDAVPVGVGAMAAILGAEAEVLKEICAEAAQGEVVSPANFNSPGQIVVAGHTGAVNRAIEIAKARGFRKAMLLPVSAPFHCALMKPAADRLAQTLEAVQVNALTAPVVSNVEAKPNSDAARVKPLLVEQVCAPVLWEQIIQNIVAAGVTNFVEIGPGKVLAGLVKRIDKEASCCNVQDAAGVKAITEVA